MKDTYGLLPPVIAHNYEREEMVDRQVSAATALYHALQDIDRRLDVVFISDRADPEYGVKPGRWHVCRKNDPPAPDSYIAIETADGKYREPDSGVIMEMQSRDLWRHGLPKQKDRDEEPKHDDSYVEELAADLRAGSRLPGDGGLYKKLWGKK